MNPGEFVDGDADWMDDGACRRPGVDPSWFFPDQGYSTAKAFQVCAGCSVRDVCLAYALKHREHGVWGGTDDGDRKRIRNRHRPIPAACVHGHQYTPDNIAYRSDGGLRCRECWRIYSRGRDAKLRLIKGGKL